jgi:imidazolonepropionase-like amidohydrolase
MRPSAACSLEVLAVNASLIRARPVGRPRFARRRVVVGLLLAMALTRAGAVHAEAVLIVADRLLDVRTGQYIEEPALLVSDERVVAIGTAAAPPPNSEEARVLNLDGLTLLPGLIDMHTHIDSDPRYGGYSAYQFSDRFWSVVMVANAARTLEAGFTTIRNLGADEWNDVGLKQAIDEGVVPGPRIVPAAISFGATGGHCDETYFPPSMQQRNPFNADSPDEGRKRVRELRKYGAEVIKICATGGVFSRNTEPGQQQLSLEEMQAVVTEAHRLGLRVAAHAHGASGIRDAIRAGVDTIEHASLIDDEGIALALEHGAALSMDIYNTDYTQSEGARNGVLEDNLRKDREIAEVQREGFRRAHSAGVTMVYGTDAGIFPHGDNARQLAVMVRYGMRPIEAIQSATLNAAVALGREDVGVLEAGRYADLVAVVGNPLEDVRVLESIPVVVKGGVVVKDARGR